MEQQSSKYCSTDRNKFYLIAVHMFFKCVTSYLVTDSLCGVRVLQIVLLLQSLSRGILNHGLEILIVLKYSEYPNI
jgi:hypothetical protein